MFDLSRSTVTKDAILDAIAGLECERQNAKRRNDSSPMEPKADLKNSLLSRCRALQSVAFDVMFDPSEVWEILTPLLEQVRVSAAEEINDESDDGEADNDNDWPALS